VFSEDVRHYVARTRNVYDIVYYDPPYDEPAMIQIVPLIVRSVAAGGILLYERRKPARGAAGGDGGLGGIPVSRIKRFGDTEVVYIVAGREPDLMEPPAE
jgi:16S rRNA G966 N2-methylase RsmD